MPRIRLLQIDDFRTKKASIASSDVFTFVAHSYQTALFESRLDGPSSWVAVSVHFDADPRSGDIRVLVYCDKPDQMEIIAAHLPEGSESLALTQLARVLTDVLDSGLSRLGLARGWDSRVLTNALESARHAAHAKFGECPSGWHVFAEGRGATAPEQPHEILFLGGGPVNGVPKAYLQEMDRLLHIISGETWAKWWSNSPVRIAEIVYVLDGARSGVRIVVGPIVKATIERPVGTIRGKDPTRLAREDVAMLAQRLALRLGLPNPPELK